MKVGAMTTEQLRKRNEWNGIAQMDGELESDWAMRVYVDRVRRTQQASANLNAMLSDSVPILPPQLTAWLDEHDQVVMSREEALKLRQDSATLQEIRKVAARCQEGIR